MYDSIEVESSKKMKQTCILVLGMHRSGTSALSGVLKSLGIDFGNNLISEASDNPKGFFEDENIIKLNDYILNKYNSYWDDIEKLELDIINDSDSLKKIKILIKENYHQNIFGLKDPRISLLLPLYKKAFKELNIELKAIVIYRNPLEVAQSLYKRNNFMQNKSFFLWIKYNILLERYSRDTNRIIISFSELMKNYSTILKSITEHLNINSTPKIHFLDINLKHNNIDTLEENEHSIVNEIFTAYKNNKNLKVIFDQLYTDIFQKSIFLLSTIVEDSTFKCNEILANNEEQKKKISTLTDELDLNINVLKDIYSSRGWKLLNILRKIKSVSKMNISSQTKLKKNEKIKKEEYLLPLTVTKNIKIDNIHNDVCIFAHYDNTEYIKEYVFYYLEKIKENGFDIIFVSTAPISDDKSLKLLSRLCKRIIYRQNIGYDFGSWCEGIRTLEAENISANNILLANDSVYGPLFDLSSIFTCFKNSDADIYGLTDSYEIEYHLQSYFLIFKKNVINTDLWKVFWSNIFVHNNKEDIIKNYEVGLSSLFMKAGFKLDTYCKSHIVAHSAILNNHIYSNKLLNNRAYNITHLMWDYVIEEYKYPFIKKELVEKNPLKLKNLTKLPYIIKNTKYNFTLIKGQK